MALETEYINGIISFTLQVVQFVDGRKWDLYTQFEVK